MSENFIISNEESALSLLQRLLNDDILGEDISSVRFKNWPTLDIYLPKTPSDSSISPTMMEAFMETQKALYRTYALLTSGTPDLRGMSSVEKEDLEFRVVVRGGSTGYLAELGKVVNSLGGSAVSRMTPTEVFISVLTIALLTSSTIAFKAWLNYKSKIRKDEIENEGKKLFLDNQIKLLEHDERFAAIIGKAIATKPILGEIESVIDSSKDSIIKAIGEENGGKVQGIDISPDFAKELLSQKRERSIVDNITGIYRVSYVNSSVPDGFKVTFTNITSGEDISASLMDTMVAHHHVSLIREAEWSKKPIQVTFHVKKLRDRFSDAVVTDVVKLDTKPRDVG